MYIERKRKQSCPTFPADGAADGSPVPHTSAIVTHIHTHVPCYSVELFFLRHFYCAPWKTKDPPKMQQICRRPRDKCLLLLHLGTPSRGAQGTRDLCNM